MLQKYQFHISEDLDTSHRTITTAHINNNIGVWLSLNNLYSYFRMFYNASIVDFECQIREVETSRVKSVTDPVIQPPRCRKLLGLLPSPAASKTPNPRAEGNFSRSKSSHK